MSISADSRRLLLAFFFLACLPAFAQEKGELLWQDEFNEEGKPNPEHWGYDLGDGCPDICGWGNNEKQTYTDQQENVRVENGKLIIEAHQLPEGGYSSARIKTKEKASWEYGYIEVRAKLPYGRGSWPAIWMLSGAKGFKWPRDGEIDIMEYKGSHPEWVYGTTHTKAYNHVKGTQIGDSIKVFQPHESFNNYALNWMPDKLEWLINGVVFHTIHKSGGDYSEWPFDQPFYLILNLAVGGNFGGEYGVDEGIWPQRMEVEYVRVYEPLTRAD